MTVHGKATTIVFPNSTPEEREEHRRFKASLDRSRQVSERLRQASQSQAPTGPRIQPTTR